MTKVLLHIYIAIYHRKKLKTQNFTYHELLTTDYHAHTYIPDMLDIP